MPTQQVPPPKLHRRKAIVSLTGGLTALATSRPSAAVPPPRVKGKWWDIHLHLTHGWYGSDRGPITADHALRWMDAHEIERACVLPLVSPEAFWYPISTDDVLHQVAGHLDRLVPFCALDPRTLETHLTSQADVIGVLKRFQDAGVRGFGEHKPRLAIDADLNLRLYEACAAVKLPVLFHLDNAANMDQPGLPRLTRVLERFPELVLIGHGKGWWASISGGLQQSDLHVGYPKGPVTPGGALGTLFERFPHLYGDLSSSGAHALLRDVPFGQAFLARWSSRLLFGTDYYDLQQKEFQQFELFQALNASPETREQVGYRNAELLFT